MHDDDKDDLPENGGGGFSERESPFQRFVRGDNRVTLIFLAMALGAIFASAIMSDHMKVSYRASPPGIRHLFWLAGIAFVFVLLFMPDKDEISFNRGISFGEFWFDGWRDWVLFATVIGVTCATLCA